ncbi:hypothetical protein GN958_ATG11837 [Phytophthora infestans]|uniref:Uncharacterized protein n=1 Tax=Phytophthora infestans TaxID=4787 RepID=A0A8S9UE33_PHYIN|nr:hypothetical protein GN958_ATG11837 [Phytophthora infestans]
MALAAPTIETRFSLDRDEVGVKCAASELSQNAVASVFEVPPRDLLSVKKSDQEVLLGISSDCYLKQSPR